MPPPFERGLAHVLSACRRAFERRATLATYQQQHVFSPVPLPLRDIADFVHLNAPQQTHVDLLEFLQGAADAGRTQLMTVNSRAFAQFAAGDDSPMPGLHSDINSSGQDDASAAAAYVEAICCPHMFRGVRDASQRALRDRNLLIEIEELRVDKVFVAAVDYSQLSESDYHALLEGERELKAPHSLDAALEHLAIRVNAQTTEVHRMTLLGEEVALVEQQNFRQWLFESRVTTPADLDWRLLAAHGVNNSARELTPRTYLSQRSTASSDDSISTSSSRDKNEDVEKPRSSS